MYNKVLADMFQQSHGQCKTVDELDDCAYKSSFLDNRDLKIPKTPEELQTYCKYVQTFVTRYYKFACYIFISIELPPIR